MSYPSRRIFNRLFEEVQVQIKAKNHGGVMEIFDRARQMTLAKTLMPLEYEYLLTGVDPNAWLTRMSPEYKRYNKEEDAPVFWLHNIPDPNKSGYTLGQIALAKFNETREEIIKRMEADRPKPVDHEAEYIKRMKDLGLSTEGTPFAKDWTIRSPGKENY